MKSIIQYELPGAGEEFNLAGERGIDPERVKREAEEAARREAAKREYDRRHQLDLMTSSLAQIREAFPADGAYEIITGATNGYCFEGQVLVVRHIETQDVICRFKCKQTVRYVDQQERVWEWDEV